MDSDRIGSNDMCESVNSFTQINKAACQYHTPDSTSIPKKGRLCRIVFSNRSEISLAIATVAQN